MIKNLEKKWLINKSKSFMIGDSLTDKQTAKKSKIYFLNILKKTCFCK